MTGTLKSPPAPLTTVGVARAAGTERKGREEGVAEEEGRRLPMLLPIALQLLARRAARGARHIHPVLQWTSIQQLTFICSVSYAADCVCACMCMCVCVCACVRVRACLATCVCTCTCTMYVYLQDVYELSCACTSLDIMDDVTKHFYVCTN